MGSNDPTKRDLIWAAIIDCGKDGNNFRLSKLKSRIYSVADTRETPSDETIRRVLRAGTDMGVIDHKAGSQYYRLSDDFTARRV